MPKIDTDKLTETFSRYATEVKVTLVRVERHLNEGNYLEACEVLNTLTERMAKTSVSMRAILIKGGYIEGDS